jgi:hypothetical protein
MDNISFSCHLFPPSIINLSAGLYARFTLSYRDVRALDSPYDLVVWPGNDLPDGLDRFPRQLKETSQS